jgi:hypothetical protein
MRKESLLAVKLLWSFSLVLSERLRHTNETVISLRGELDRMRSEVSEATTLPSMRTPFGGAW